MPTEVETKHRLASPADLKQRLEDHHPVWADPADHVDCYFAHPVRDFAATDEALRMRRVENRVELTYKGPKLDAMTKSREEIEVALAEAADYGRLSAMLTALGFHRVAEVHKQRETAAVAWQGLLIDVSLDQVEGVGDFVELEIVTEDDIEPARAALMSFAEHLGLGPVERRSYLELYLATQ